MEGADGSGATLEAPEDEKRTRTRAGATTPTTTSTGSHPSLGGGRFAPGEVLAARYRVVSLIGRGGMGDVYRAEDLKLGEVVALKFLPVETSQSKAALARLHEEVRLARQISHPNVVRVHDIGESEGLTFLSMEYVDGEDLASLLRRIGHLPESKALELARQLCAGLHAAHSRGVLHRDLKPANVMIDGDGKAKITDFGLARVDGEVALDGAGTPRYMSPEQLRGQPATLASDIYALGLVLFEMLIGEQAFEGDMNGLRRERAKPDFESLERRLEATDPLVAETVLACLQPDPSKRPTRPVDVAASLPGGNFFAAALAAGETPSPAALVQAPIEGVLSKVAGAVLLVLTISSLLTHAWFAGHISILTVDGLPLKPDVLEYRARDFLASQGLNQGENHVGWLHVSSHYWDSLAASPRALDDWRGLAEQRPSLVSYTYREGDSLAVARWFRYGARFLREPHDPPLWQHGTSTLKLDSRGRLVDLVSAPDPLTVAAPAPVPVDWQPFFEASGLDPEAFSAATPIRSPGADADLLQAWSGHFKDQPKMEVLAEGAARNGVPMLWRVSVPGAPEGTEVSVPFYLPLGLLLLMLGFGGVLARQNIRNGRADFRSATVLAVLAASIPLLNGLSMWGRQVFSSFTTTFGALALATLLGVIAWLTYVALEPALRRHSPLGMVAWSRLMAGKVTDPLIGRDLLIGLGATGTVQTLMALRYSMRLEGGESLAAGYPHGLGPLWGVAPAMGLLFHPTVLLVPFSLMFLAMAPHVILRRARLEKLADFLGVALIVAFGVLWTGGIDTIVYVLGIAVIARFVGLVALVGVSIFMSTRVLAPVTLDPSQWWFQTSTISLVFLVVVACYAFLIATRGGMRPSVNA